MMNRQGFADQPPSSVWRTDPLSERAHAAGGLISRRVEAGPPVSVTYALTDRGRALMPALEQIALWASQHLPES